MKYILLAALLMLSPSLSEAQTIVNQIQSTIVDNQNTEELKTIIEDTISHDKSDDLTLTFGGYLEAFYNYNIGKPENNLNALRGFDYISSSLTVANFVLGTDAKYKNFSTRLAINIGMSPTQFYKQEPVTSASNQIPSLNSSTWQFIQEALVNYDFEKVKGLSVQMGIMATPIGIEGLPSFQTWENSTNNHHMHRKDYRENWNFSRSNAFIHVPDYHSGIRLLYSPNEKSTYSFYVINGQNMVTDNNVDKTIAVSYLWTPTSKVHLSALYMGGNERPTGSPEGGSSWRHLFDFHTRFNITNKLSFMAQMVPGFETNNFGTNKFLINAIYLKQELKPSSHIALRYEHLLEKIATGSNSNFLETFDENNEAGLYGLTLTYSQTLVKDHLMVRIEYRHDYGTEDWFFEGELEPSGDEIYPFLTNTNKQNTLSFSVVGWF